MKYCKETHYIVAYDDSGKMCGKWNMHTNEFIGIKGTVLKSKSPAFSISNMKGMNKVLISAYQFIHNNVNYYHAFSTEYGKRLEEIVSVGLKVSSNDWRLYEHFLENKQKLTKDCVDYINTHYRGEYSLRSINGYTVYKNFKETVAKCVGEESWATDVFSNVHDDVPTDFSKAMVLRGYHEKVFVENNGRSFAEIINEWYNMIRGMGDTLEVKHNILTNYAILKWVFNEYRTAHYEETLKAYNDKRWLYFENDEYIVRPLISRADFHNEGEAQQNCVERMYMERVANGATHVVVVRKKANPNDSYITCEVNNTGVIIQYLYRFNQIVDNQSDKDFRCIYQEHLLSSLKE